MKRIITWTHATITLIYIDSLCSCLLRGWYSGVSGCLVAKCCGFGFTQDYLFV